MARARHRQGLSLMEDGRLSPEHLEVNPSHLRPHAGPRLLTALFRIARVVALVAGIFATWSLLKRLPLDPNTYNALVLAGSALLVLAVWRFRRDYMPWAVLLGGMNLYALLWFYGDQTGWGPFFEYVVRFDQAVGFGELPTVSLQDRLYSPGSVAAHDVGFTVVYMSFFVAPYVAFVSLWFHARPMADRFVHALLAALFTGLVLIFALPTAPPWMAAEAGLVAPIDRVAHELLAGVNSSVYEETYELAGVNDVAAMPSIHMTVTVVVAVMLARVGGRRGAVSGAAYVLAMGIALVYLGEHYALDVLAGIATGWAGWRASDWLARRTVRTEVADLTTSDEPSLRRAA